MKKNITIGRYIGIQVILLISLLVFVYSLSIDKVYQWGVYDTSHYYMSLEADSVWNSIQKTGDVPEVPNSHVQYYLSTSHLPDELLKLFPTASHQDGVLQQARIAQTDYMFLPYAYENEKDFFYVVHFYSQIEDDYSVLIGVTDLQLLLAGFILLIVFFLIRYLALSIIFPVTQLQKWAVSIADDSTEELDTSSLKFVELSSVANELKRSIKKIEQSNKREKRFLQTLSHELRTPLAVTKAALEILQNSHDELDDKTLIKIDRIKRANENMLSTTHSLLLLWKSSSASRSKEAINLYQLIENKLIENQYLIKNKSVKLDNQVAKEATVLVDKELITIVINNLVRNAFQYTDDGLVELSLTDTLLVITNSLTNDIQSVGELSNDDSDDDYGYGVGIYLVEKICTEAGWGLYVESSSEIFQVKIKL